MAGRAERIVDGVYRVLRGYVNAYVIEGDDGLTVVDTGLPRAGDRLLQAIEGLPDVRAILLTHHHPDHVGGSATVAGRTHAPVHAPAGDLAVIRAKSPRPHANPDVPWSRWLGRLSERFGPRHEARLVDVGVADGDELPFAGGISVIGTPGHTLGHVSYLVRRGSGILLAGDAAGAMGSKVGPPVSGPFAMFTEDLDQARQSFRKLAGLRFETAVFGHGKPIRSGASEAFRANLDRL